MFGRYVTQVSVQKADDLRVDSLKRVQDGPTLVGFGKLYRLDSARACSRSGCVSGSVHDGDDSSNGLSASCSRDYALNPALLVPCRDDHVGPGGDSSVGRDASRFLRHGHIHCPQSSASPSTFECSARPLSRSTHTLQRPPRWQECRKADRASDHPTHDRPVPRSSTPTCQRPVGSTPDGGDQGRNPPARSRCRISSPGSRTTPRSTIGHIPGTHTTLLTKHVVDSISSIASPVLGIQPRRPN